MPKPCAIRDCPNELFKASLCQAHYWRVRRHGTIELTRPTEEDRFWAKVNKTDSCWLWTAAVFRNSGYGQFHTRGKTMYAHRISWEYAFGSCPDGLVLDHLCHVRKCVNPAHLEPVTRAENTYRAVSPVTENKAKTHCQRGHEFTPENTYVPPGKNQRHCRTCRREQMAESRADKPKKKAGRYTYASHCVNGHAFAEHGFNSGKQRRCRICHNATSRRNAAKRRAASAQSS